MEVVLSLLLFFSFFLLTSLRSRCGLRRRDLFGLLVVSGVWLGWVRLSQI